MTFSESQVIAKLEKAWSRNERFEGIGWEEKELIFIVYFLVVKYYVFYMY